MKNNLLLTLTYLDQYWWLFCNVILLSVQCIHSIGQNIKSLDVSVVRCPVFGICGQDCDVIYGPIFTKLGA